MPGELGTDEQGVAMREISPEDLADVLGSPLSDGSLSDSCSSSSSSSSDGSSSSSAGSARLAQDWEDYEKHQAVGWFELFTDLIFVAVIIKMSDMAKHMWYESVCESV